MAIPDGTLYHDGALSAGMVATIEPSTVNTETAGADIAFGAGVVLKDGKAIPATNGPIYGVALKRTYSNVDHFYEEDLEKDHWNQGEDLGILRDGTVAVPLSDDVDRGENAMVDADGKFKKAGANDEVVGVFLSSGDKDSTANLQVRIKLASGASDGGADRNDDDAHNVQPPKDAGVTDNKEN